MKTGRGLFDQRTDHSWAKWLAFDNQEDANNEAQNFSAGNKRLAVVEVQFGIMNMKCLACGATKETSIKELYPYPDDGVVDDRPIDPLCVIDCQGPLMRPGDTISDWRVVIVCHQCYHNLEPDMWISDRCWESLNPVTPFERLPHPLEEKHPGDRFQVEAYAASLQ